MARIETVKVTSPETRKMAIEVLEKVYLREKNWLRSIKSEIAEDVGESERVSWFVATLDGRPAGVLRLFYDPPLEFPEEFQVTLNKDFDLEEVARTCRFVEIGRFAIVPAYRKNIYIALRLMRASIREVVERDYSHFLTDVFEGEVNSPLRFHTRILGFEVIGRHLHGELNCSLTRIILTLDILKAYKRLKQKRNRIYRMLLQGIADLLDKKVAEEAGAESGMSAAYLRKAA